MEPIAITGAELITGAGFDFEEHLTRLRNGTVQQPQPITEARHGFDPQKSPRAYKSNGGGCVTTAMSVPCTFTELCEMFSVRKGIRYERHQIFAFVVAHAALAQSALTSSMREEMGCFIGTGGAGSGEACNALQRITMGKALEPSVLMRFLPGMLAGLIAQKNGLSGYSAMLGRGCTASADALSFAIDQIHLGKIGSAVCGGAEAPITDISIAAFCGSRVLGSNSLPYSSLRNGLIPGEGAAMLVFENLTHAHSRGARIYARVAGYSSGMQILSRETPFTDIAPNGVARVVMKALESADMQPADVEHIYTHATGTEQGDLAELEGIATAWRAMGATKYPSVSSVKSFTGHTFGASGATSVVLAARALHEGVILPNYGLTEAIIDPLCAQIGFPLPARLEYRSVKASMVLSHGFGGAYSCFILKKP